MYVVRFCLLLLIDFCEICIAGVYLFIFTVSSVQFLHQSLPMVQAH